MTHQFHPMTLRECDIRGIIDETLSEADAYAIGRGFATLIARAGRKCIVVGYDGRVSSPALEDALIKGLNDSGVDAVSVGMGPTPMPYYAEPVLDEADGGIPITGSHNPANYKGFKMVFQGRRYFGANIRTEGEMAPMINMPKMRFQIDETRKFVVVGEILERLAASGATVNATDGKHANTANGWWLLRATNPQGVLVARGEQARH